MYNLVPTQPLKRVVTFKEFHVKYCTWLIDFSVLIRLRLITLKKCPELVFSESGLI